MNFVLLAQCKPDWCYPCMGKEMNELLKQCIDIPPFQPIDDIEIISGRSKQFPIPFPVDTMRLETLKKTRPIERLKSNIVSTYPIVHERVLLLITHFIIYKREFGSPMEKALYSNMSIPDNDGWEQVGTFHQKPPLEFDKCLSYDEIKLSAMLYVSGHTECINDGNRCNAGVVDEDNIEENAVIIGLIGPRFERIRRMDYEDILITEQQNTIDNGYGEEVTPTTCLNVLKTTYVRNNQSAKHMWRQIWAEFYQVHSYTYNELASNIPDNSEDEYLQRYVRLSSDIFDNEVYYKRVSVLAESALIEGDTRGREAGRDVFLNVIGCGLGVWKKSPHQTDVYVLTFLERIRALLKRDLLNHVSDVNFSYIKPAKGVSEKREPSAKLTGEHAGKLLVMTYPWDGNAQPGNEFWMGSLKGSGDPAAACSTQVAELHNAHINPAVSGYNLRVIGRSGLKTLSEYCLALTCKPDWSYPSMDKDMNELLRQCIDIPIFEQTDDINVITEKSKQLATLRERRPIERLKSNVVSTYPVVHERVLLLMTRFLIYKREFGSPVEKDLYTNMSIPEFVDRLLKKRAISFFSRLDSYTLLTGETGDDGWEQVGTSQEIEPLKLDNCLSYDEMKLSAMLYISGHTECINDGSLIGPRFVRIGRMDYEDILITVKQNTISNGYGEEVTSESCLDVLTKYFSNNQTAKHMWRQIWAEFYQVHSHIYKELNSHVPDSSEDKHLQHYVRLPSVMIFDNEVYYKRVNIFTNRTDSEKLSEEKRIFIECKNHPRGGINVQIERREPSAKLIGEHAGKLLVLTYPWDSNAHPGNDFWMGSLKSSGDPAAACSTQVAELHNAHINPAVSGYNLRVIGRNGLKTLSEYCLTLTSSSVDVDAEI
ncbi:unnamed protein product [Leptidea sinapis]|uniref:Uncharacterized protein n=1 Tax=Leptidea sinapis TaxID=189913 RepID=A0A5E4PNJ8_9NEOP|nr:unnamed protein product [Leptidea sinapis]